MVEEHIFKVSYQWSGRKITTIHLSKRETVEFIAGIGGQKVLDIYEKDRLARPETALDLLRAAQAFNQDQGFLRPAGHSECERQEPQPRC